MYVFRSKNLLVQSSLTSSILSRSMFFKIFPARKSNALSKKQAKKSLSKSTTRYIKNCTKKLRIYFVTSFIKPFAVDEYENKTKTSV